MALPGQSMGSGFYVRTAYVAENLRYYPGLWHTGENWFIHGDQTWGSTVYAAGAGQVVFANYNYPGRVVIVQHAGDLFSMYGHLDYDLPISVGQEVARGDPLGVILARTDDINRSHLHFEFRDFLTDDEVNGEAPVYNFTCGYECPPGPGYWPMDAPHHPSEVGWLNSTHLIGHRAFATGKPPKGASVIVNSEPEESAAIWSAPHGSAGAKKVGDLPLSAGDEYSFLKVSAGREASRGTSSEEYHLWYEIGLPNGKSGWVQAAVPWALEVGSDGRPCSIRFNFLPAAPLASE